MKAKDLKPLVGGSVTRIVERFPSERIARSKLNLAHKTMRYAKDHYYNGLNGPLAPVTWTNGLTAFLDPEDPCVIVYGHRDPTLDTRRHVYGRVLRLAVGESCVIQGSASTLDSVKARLKQMAAEVEAAIGARPCWTAKWADSVKSGPNPVVITRLPDDYDPATGEPRDSLTGQRQKQAKVDWARFNTLSFAYDEAVCEAETEGRPRPEPPQELLELAERLSPEDLPYLKGETYA